MGKKYWALMGEYDAESTTYTAFAGGGGSSPFTPSVPGRLIGLRVVPNRSAATSLINHVAIELSCSLFTPNAIECGGQGTGLQTAPALQQGSIDYEVDQPVAPGNPIKLKGKNVTADTPVTVSVLLYGYFEAS